MKFENEIICGSCIDVMMTMIARNKKRRPFFGLLNSEESQRKAKEHLKSLGYDFDKQPKLVWPEGAVAAWHDHFYGEWKFRYKSDILREKKERMKQNLRLKRQDGTTEIRALYVWVFWCPGIFGFAYRGWWTYLIGRGIDSGKYLRKDRKLMSRIMELFPAEPALFGNMNIDEWMQWFVRNHHRGKWCGKPQGKSAVWAEIRGDNIEEILGRAEWPNQKTIGNSK